VTYSGYPSGQNVVGTGPFLWSSYKPGDRLELTKNPHYWNNGKPYLEHVTLRIITDPTALFAAMQSGEIDVANRMLARDAIRLKGDKRFVVTGTPASEVYVGANINVKPLDDIRVRQAIGWALDRKRIADQVFSGFGFPSALSWTAQTPGMKPSYRTYYRYDPARAQQLLRAAGAQGAKISVVAFPGGPEFAATRDIVNFNLQEIGLSPSSVSYDSAGFSLALQGGSLPGLYVISNALSAWGPSAALAASFPLEPEKNSSNVEDPKYLALGDRLKKANSPSQIAGANAAVTNYLLQQAFHMPVVQAATPIVAKSGVTGLKSDLTLALDLTSVRNRS
jgi:peptide/nickel transport system substrate-binding protein